MADHDELIQRLRRAEGSPIPSVLLLREARLALEAAQRYMSGARCQNCETLRLEIGELRAEVDRLRTENKRLRKDAQRYRWLCQNWPNDAVCGQWTPEAIDAAMGGMM